MAFTKVQPDNVNKTVQFSIKEDAQSVSVMTNAEFGNADLDGANVTVELVMTGKMNQTLFNDTFGNLKKVLKGFFPSLDRVIPFALDKSLILNDNAYLLVTIKWDAATPMTDFGYQINKYVQNTDVPLAIKKKTVAVSEDINTEFYPILLVDGSTKELETVVMVDNGTGVLQPQKINYSSPLIKSLIPATENYLPMLLQNNQKVKITGDNVSVYLLQVK